MTQASEHAEQVAPGWNQRAYDAFVAFARITPLFKTEDARIAAYEGGLEHPPTDRAWGSIAARARRNKIVSVERMEMSEHGPGNAGYRPLYRSLVVSSAAIEEFADHVFFTADKLTKGWAVLYEPRPKRLDESRVSYGLRFPFLIASEYVKDSEKMVRRAAEVLNRHWRDRA